MSRGRLLTTPYVERNTGSSGRTTCGRRRRTASDHGRGPHDDPSGAASGSNFGATLSAPAIPEDTAWFPAGGDLLGEFPGGGNIPIGGPGCEVAPVVAKGVVYAMSCTNLGAYVLDTGIPLWSVITSQPSGLAVADGVL